MIDGVILAAIIAACALCVSVYQRTRAEQNAALIKKQAAAEKVEMLVSQNEKLARDVKQLQTDAKTIESFARQKYGYVRAGDVVIKVAEDRVAVATSSTDIKASKQSESW